MVLGLCHVPPSSFMNRRGLSANPYLSGASNGYAHPSGSGLHYDDVPCVNGSVSDPQPAGPRECTLALGPAPRFPVPGTSPVPVCHLSWCWCGFP